MEGDGGAAPELGGQGVPEHLGLAVVAGGAERLPEPGVVGVVAVPAAIPVAVGAADTLAVWVAGQHQAALGLASVDPAEARGGEGHEQPRMLAHRLGDALAALEAGGQELVGVGPVDGGTGGALGLPAGCRTPSTAPHPAPAPSHRPAGPPRSPDRPARPVRPGGYGLHLLMQGPGVDAPGLVGGGTGVRLAAAPAPPSRSLGRHLLSVSWPWPEPRPARPGPRGTPPRRGRSSTTAGRPGQ